MAALSIPLDRADEIIITPQLALRPDRPADLRREAEAFRQISEAIVADPAGAVQRFLEIAIRLCDADAAGLSMPDDNPERPLFRWDALAGVYADFVGGSVPRDASPCGLARTKRRTIIVSRPGRVFPEFSAVEPAIEEGMIVPFYDNGGQFMGTIWVVHTKPGGRFCANDLRVMEQLAVQLVLALKLMREQSGTREIQQMLDRSLDAHEFTEPAAYSSPDLGEPALSPVDSLKNDIAHLVEASAFLQSVLASSSDCIKVLDLKGHIEFVNDGGLRILAVPDIDMMRGWLWQDAWTGAERLLAEDAVKNARQGNASRFRGTSPTFAGEEKFWDVQLTPIRHNGDSISHILAISRDVTEQKRVEQQREILAGELDHRIKNILAMVVAIAHQTLRAPATLEAASKAFVARISALGEAQSILTRSSWESADIDIVIRGALAAHQNGADDPRFLIDGPSLHLPPSKALSLALAIHELATNAAKYGALSTDKGRIDIRWSMGEEHLRLAWRESGGPAVTEPEHRGFGSRLIERALAAEFRGKVRIDFAPQGVLFELVAPVKGLAASATA